MLIVGVSEDAGWGLSRSSFPHANASLLIPPPKFSGPILSRPLWLAIFVYLSTVGASSSFAHAF